jgi:hypothetical protein
MFTHFDKNYIAGLCEKANLFHRALENYSDIEQGFCSNMNKEEQVEIRTAIIQGNLEELSRLVKPYNINAPMQLCGLWLHNNYGTYGIFSRVCQVHGNQYNWDFRYPSEKKN